MKKKTYLVEVKNERGDTKNEWMDEEAIKFIDPEFLDRVTAGSSGNAKGNNTTQSESTIKSKLPHSLSIAKLTVAAHNDLKCKECGRQFKRRDHLKDYIRTQHLIDKDQYKSPICSSTFGYRSNSTQHMLRK